MAHCASIHNLPKTVPYIKGTLCFSRHVAEKLHGNGIAVVVAKFRCRSVSYGIDRFYLRFVRVAAKQYSNKPKVDRPSTGNTQAISGLSP